MRVGEAERGERNEPTRIYCKPLLKLFSAINVHALCHITGGGLLENLPRVMPDGTSANIATNSWSTPEIFNWLQTKGNVSDAEMHKTFNCGIGMIVCVPEQQAGQALQILQKHNRGAFEIGVIAECDENNPSVIMSGG